MSYPPFFTSEKNFDNYLACISNIKIGDEVECILNNNDNFADRSHRKENYESYIILPIVGVSKDTRIHHNRYYTPSMVGLDEITSYRVGCGYAPGESSLRNYRITPSLKLKVYANSNLDIIYKRIIKRK